MQALIDSFVKPPLHSLHHFSPPVRTLDGHTVIRKDQTLKGIPVSVFSCKNQDPKGVILYCHSLGSNKYEAETLLPLAVRYSMKLVCFTFQRVDVSDPTGTSLDQNGILTFGFHEAQQVSTIVDWLKAQSSGPVIVWGRSMGAVSSLRSQLLNTQADGLVLDSPYESLREAIIDIMDSHILIPKLMVQSLYGIFKGSLERSIGFEIDKLDLGVSLDDSDGLGIPCVFIGSKSDKLCGDATQRLYTKFKGQKEMIFSDTHHSSPREEVVLEQTLRTIICLIKSSQKHKSHTKVLVTARKAKQSFSSSQTGFSEPDTLHPELKLDTLGCRRRHTIVETDLQLPTASCFRLCS